MEDTEYKPIEVDWILSTNFGLEAGDMYPLEPRVTSLEIEWIRNSGVRRHSKLRLMLDETTWDTAERGHILHDRLFLEDVEDHLLDLNIAGEIRYLPPAEQGDNYVAIGLDAKATVCIKRVIKRLK